MSRTVECRRYKKTLPGLDKAPFPGPKGEDIFEHVSAQAWQDWLKHQTLLVNEKHINMMDPQGRKYLFEQMDKFLSGDEVDQADGYVPE